MWPPVIALNENDLGFLSQGGKVIWWKYGQVTNNPEKEVCTNVATSYKSLYSLPKTTHCQETIFTSGLSGLSDSNGQWGNPFAENMWKSMEFVIYF